MRFWFHLRARHLRPFTLHLSIFILLSSLLTVALPSSPAMAQVQIEETSVDYTFGDLISFFADFRSAPAIEEAFILIDTQGSSRTLTEQAEVTPNNQVVFILDLQEQPLRAFASVDYRFRLQLENGETYTTQAFNFFYEDNRFDWQTIQEGPFRVHWYSGDLAFAQNVLDVAEAGMARIRSLISLPPADETTQIYVYDSAQAMQATLDPTNQSWVAGHADPDLGVLVVALPSGPEQQFLMEQRIPHEMMHISLYRTAGESYSNMPVWFSEGLASIAELYPNSDYQILLDNAFEKETLLPMASLCQTFPRDASNALLAYAQSASFTRFLHKNYGTTGLDALIAGYANGLGCERGVDAALDRNLGQLERQWRQEAFAENVNMTAFNNLLPWLVLLLVPLIPTLGFSLGRLRARTA